jgi:hypothetical protein
MSTPKAIVTRADDSPIIQVIYMAIACYNKNPIISVLFLKIKIKFIKSSKLLFFSVFIRLLTRFFLTRQFVSDDFMNILAYVRQVSL